MTHWPFAVILSSHIGNFSQVRLKLHRSGPTDWCNWHRLQYSLYWYLGRFDLLMSDTDCLLVRMNILIVMMVLHKRKSLCSGHVLLKQRMQCVIWISVHCVLWNYTIIRSCLANYIDICMLKINLWHVWCFEQFCIIILVFSQSVCIHVGKIHTFRNDNY